MTGFRVAFGGSRHSTASRRTSPVWARSSVAVSCRQRYGGRADVMERIAPVARSTKQARAFGQPACRCSRHEADRALGGPARPLSPPGTSNYVAGQRLGRDRSAGGLWRFGKPGRLDVHPCSSPSSRSSTTPMPNAATAPALFSLPPAGSRVYLPPSQFGRLCLGSAQRRGD